jgi:hypothetical protein
VLNSGLGRLKTAFGNWIVPLTLAAWMSVSNPKTACEACQLQPNCPPPKPPLLSKLKSAKVKIAPPSWVSDALVTLLRPQPYPPFKPI